MTDPATIGAFAASALATAAEAALNGAIGEAAKDAYKALKSRVAQWAGSDVEALEKTPASSARKAVVAEVIDGQPIEEQAALRMLVMELVAALKHGNMVGIDIDRLEAMDVQLGDITVTEGTGLRLKEVRVHDTFSVETISVGGPAKKA